MKRLFSLVLAYAFVCSTIATADEGMWLYNEAPKDKIRAKYAFDVTQQWLDHVRLSSVRFNNGGSGSFVSANGLTFTNHHVGSECIQQLSTGGKDYLKNGFYAKTEAEEGKCPDLELNVLEEIEDVTAKVNAAVKPGAGNPRLPKNSVTCCRLWSLPHPFCESCQPQYTRTASKNGDCRLDTARKNPS